MGFILSILAFILFIIVGVINFFVVLYKHATVKSFFKTIDIYWFDNAYALDVFGNFSYRTTWNLMFKKDDGYKFGASGETISSALGKNQRDNTLTKIGKVICFILDTLDKNHCQKSIKEL